MDYYMSILQGILMTDGSFLDVYLDGLDEHKQFGVQNNEATVMQHVSSLLATSKTRTIGLRLLDKFIDNCSTDVVEKKGNFWTTLVLKACNNQELQFDAPLICNVLSKIIKRSQQVPDLAKSIMSTHILKIFESLTNVPPPTLVNALIVIETCLRAYPGSSAPSRGVIERFLWKYIDHTDYEVVQNCGKCLHLLQYVKGGGVQGVNHKTQWKNYQLQLLGGIHSVYNKMFTNCTEIYDEKIEQENLPGETYQIDFDSDPVKKAAQMYIRCRNMVTYLIIALKEPFPVEKPILIKKILNILVRGLNVNCLILERRPIADNIALSILLPKLHVDLLNLLHVAITILRGHLRPYSELILGLMVDALKWTSTKDVCDDQKTLQYLRRKVYDTVSLWCKILHSGNRCEATAEYLLPELIRDISPTEGEFTLKVLRGARKDMSKKVRRLLHTSQNEKSNMAKTYLKDSDSGLYYSEKGNQELCISALRCLQEVIFSVGNFVKPTILKIIHMSVTQISAIFYELNRKPDHLYSNKDCRIEIYNTMYAILMTRHHLCPPPTELIFAVIQTACVRDDSLKVRTHCGFIIQNLEKIIHPQKESLLFTIEEPDIRNAFVQVGQENLLRGFQFNLLNSSFYNKINEQSESTNLLRWNTSLANGENCGIQRDNKAQTSASENNKETQNEHTCCTDKIENVFNEFKKIFTNEIETTESQVVNDTEALSEETCKPINKNIDNLLKSPEIVLCVGYDADVKTVNEEKEEAVNESNVAEPLTKKLKLNKTNNIAENCNIINNLDEVEYTFSDIADNFVDELA